MNPAKERIALLKSFDGANKTSPVIGLIPFERVIRKSDLDMLILKVLYSLEEPIKNDEILSYKDKYMGDGAKGGKLGAKGAKTGMKMGMKSSGMASLSRKIPADLTKSQED